MRRILLALGFVLLVAGFMVTRYVEQERRTLPQERQYGAWADGAVYRGYTPNGEKVVDERTPQRQIFIIAVVVASAGAGLMGLAFAWPRAREGVADDRAGGGPEPVVHRLGGRQR